MQKKRDHSLITQIGLPEFLTQLFKEKNNARIAVPFWGNTAPEMLGLAGLKSAKILCNLPSGACNPKIIEPLMADFDVKSHDRLHGKVYWTPKLAVVGSSNASTNGLVPVGDDLKGWHEANIIVNDIPTLNELKAWFDRLWEEAEDIDSTLLAEAAAKYKGRKGQSKINLARGSSLISTAMKDPDAFRKSPIYLGFFHEGLSDPVKKHRNARARRERKQKIGDRVFRGKDLEYFENWAVPKDSWIVECDLKNEARPKVWGATFIPNSLVLNINGSKVMTGYLQQGVTLNGRYFGLPDVDKELLKAYSQTLYGESNENSLLHISDAADILNQQRRERGALAAFACEDSLNFNRHYRVYYEPFGKGRKLQTSRFIGLYDNWTVKFVGEITGTSIATFRNGHLADVDHETGVPPTRHRLRIQNIEKAVRHIHDLRSRPHRFYFIRSLHKVKLTNTAGAGIRRLKIIDIAKALGVTPEELDIRSAQDLARLLNGKTFR